MRSGTVSTAVDGEVAAVMGGSWLGPAGILPPAAPLVRGNLPGMIGSGWSATKPVGGRHAAYGPGGADPGDAVRAGDLAGGEDQAGDDRQARHPDRRRRGQGRPGRLPARTL